MSLRFVAGVCGTGVSGSLILFFKGWRGLRLDLMDSVCDAQVCGWSLR